MRTTTMSIGSLLEHVDRNEIRLPEIQRGYVWKSGQVANLVDSLYRSYPSGALLLWETQAPVTERAAAIEGPSATPISKPLYLLDGQQRLTSLFRVWSGDDRARIVFNVETERFQNESAATRKDKRWVYVHELLRDKISAFALAEELSRTNVSLGPDQIFDRLARVRRIVDYLYHIEILEDMPYAEVTEIFVRVNSKGRPLRQVDLALATLSARWPGVIRKLESEADRWAEAGFGKIDIGLLTRCLAALSTETAGFEGFAGVDESDLEKGWERTKRGLEHLVTILQSNAGIHTSSLLPSVNALVPLVAFLGSREEAAFSPGDADALIYWLFGAFLLGRYNQSVDTVISQDVAAIRRPDPLKNLFSNLGLLGSRLVVTEDALTGRGAGSPYFLFSYLAARTAGATDWYFGVNIGTQLEGSLKLEYHHIHPRVTLKELFTKAEINDLANLAFISGKANRKIGGRSPERYFAELTNEELAKHFVPLDPTLRSADAYPRFVRERRRQLAAAITDLLDRYRPEEYTSDRSPLGDPATGEALVLTVYSSYPEASNGVVYLSASAKGETFEAIVPVGEFIGFVEDLQNGLSASLTVAGDTSTVPSGAEIIEVAIGPLRATGTLSDWEAVLERELAAVEPVERAPMDTATAVWTGDRTFFPIVDAE